MKSINSIGDHMKIRSVATGATLGALTLVSIALSQSAAAAMQPQSLGAADQNTTAHFHVYLPLSNTAALDQLLQSQTDSNSPNYHRWLTPAQFKQQFGPTPATEAKAKGLLPGAGFAVVGEKTQNLEVECPVPAGEKLFNTHIQ